MVTPLNPHWSRNASDRRSRSPEGSCMSGSATSTKCRWTDGSIANLPRLDALADHLLVDLGFGRHVDDDIAHHLGLTAQTAPVDQPANALVAILDRVPFGQGVGGDRHAMLGKLAIARGDLALGTDAAPAADGIKVHPQLPRGRQDRRAKRQSAPACPRG